MEEAYIGLSIQGATIVYNQQSDSNQRNLQQEKLEFLLWNYQQCQTGYHSRDQMTNDIFVKISQIFTFYITLLSLPFFARITDYNIIKWYLLFLLVSGSLSIFVLILILNNMIDCKIALREQCTFIEGKINNRYLQEIASLSEGRQCTFYRYRNAPIGNCFMKTYTGSLVQNCRSGFPKDLDKRFNQHWECICKRKTIIFKGNSDEEKCIIEGAAGLLLFLWIFIVLFLLTHLSIYQETLNKL